jgi:hypothetical protein
MLAKTPLTAAQHGVTEEELQALLWVRNALATGLIKDRRGADAHKRFDMATSCSEGGTCGTVACIGGWMGMHMGLGERGSQNYVNKHSPGTPEDGERSTTPFSPLFWPMDGMYVEAFIRDEGKRSGNRAIHDFESPYRLARRWATPQQAVAAIDRWLEGERDVVKLWPKE